MAKPLTLASSAAVSRRAQQGFPPTVIRELETLEADLGGRQQIVGMLVLAPLTPDLRYILGLLGDPQHSRTSLADICVLANVLPGDLLKQLSSAALLRGKVKASQHIGDGIAAVAKDVMRRAAPYEDACSSCLGAGQVTDDPTPQVPNPAPQPCETCQGTGRLVYRPSLETQKLAIDMAQLLPKSGGIQIAQINAPQAGVGGQGALEQLQAMTDRILYGSGTPLPPAVDEGAEGLDEVVEGDVAPSAGGEEG